jgi:hypothetical protein
MSKPPDTALPLCVGQYKASHHDSDPERISRIRQDLLGPGWAFEPELAAALRVSTRTIQRLPLPWKRGPGGKRVYDVPAAHEVIKRHLTPSE